MPEIDTRPTIAVIDDDPLWLEFVRQVLEESPYAMVGLSSTLGAAKQLEEIAPSVVLVDLKMAGAPGDVFISGARRAQQLPGAKLVICSNAPFEELQRVSRWAGADGFIRKTPDPDELLARVRKYL